MLFIFHRLINNNNPLIFALSLYSIQQKPAAFFTLDWSLFFKKKLHGLSPRANYTDRATTTCQRSDCQLIADRGCYVVSVTDPYGRILGFLDISR
jgi:hypothetical protein